MRKLLLLLLLPVLATAQYSRWNYSDALPNNVAADAKLIAFYSAAMTNHATGELRIFKAYRYPAVTDSSFELPDMSAKIVRLFDPTLAPDGATELAREDTVVVLSKHSPLVKTVIVGGDGILPPHQAVKAIDRAILEAARVEAKILRSKVNTKCTAGKKLKRKDAWTAAKAERKAEKAAKGKSINK